MRERIRRLEGHRDPDRCSECGDRIITKEIAEDGTVTYPHGRPCEACGSRGRICRLVVDMRDPKDRPEDGGLVWRSGRGGDTRWMEEEESYTSRKAAWILHLSRRRLATG